MSDRLRDIVRLDGDYGMQILDPTYSLQPTANSLRWLSSASA
jgi:hypothetical protein